ncbi:hypothetical protein GCM10009759_19090 [Kitasatospora saccharophila]|uniref:Uncharacterized protein n=1 Tax=Kitasatospora saccharophila TaxID=407973 RepID=A0ABP5I7E1_9ACTN
MISGPDSERVDEIAERLGRLTGDRPSVTSGKSEGAVRVSVRVRGLHDEELAMAVLAELGRADRYGHRRSQHGEYVWAEVGGASVLNGGLR